PTCSLSIFPMLSTLFFFFQAEDGIRDKLVTGVQTCALPISTNDEKDVWFIGFSPDLVVGVFMGYDKPRHIADRATGGALAAPIVRDFMKVALADKPAVPFRVPSGIKLIRVDPRSGHRAVPGDTRVILEAFK